MSTSTPVSVYLRECLRQQCMSQTELAKRCGVPLSTIRSVLAGARLKVNLMLSFDIVLGVPTHVWHNLQRDYLIQQARIRIAAKNSQKNGIAEPLSTR